MTQPTIKKDEEGCSEAEAQSKRIIERLEEERGNTITACATGTNKEEIAERKGYADGISKAIKIIKQETKG